MAIKYALREKHQVNVPAGDATIIGDLVVPQDAHGIVLFAHGSGSGRFSPRNVHVASVLNHAGLATLLIDLLTEEEEQIDMETGQLRFDIEFLSQRLSGAIDWIRNTPRIKRLDIGLFGASTGAAAALIAAAEYPCAIKAIVSRGGRPDLANNFLSEVKAPTLLIVGGDDEPVIEMNKAAMECLKCVKKLEIVPGASHLFEESGKLEEVARLAREWFEKHLGVGEL